MWGFVLPYLFNPDKANLGAKVAFIFGGLCVLSLVYLYFYQPETKGRSYEELDEMFMKHVTARDFKDYATEAQQRGEVVQRRASSTTGPEWNVKAEPDWRDWAGCIMSNRALCHSCSVSLPHVWLKIRKLWEKLWSTGYSSPVHITNLSLSRWPIRLEIWSKITITLLFHEGDASFWLTLNTDSSHDIYTIDYGLVAPVRKLTSCIS